MQAHLEPAFTGPILIDNGGAVGPSPRPWHAMEPGEFSGICVDPAPGKDGTLVCVSLPSAPCMAAARAVLTRIAAPFTVISPGNLRGINQRSAERLTTWITNHPSFLYHACLDFDLPGIRASGLVISTGSLWHQYTKDAALDGWCLGKLFFSPTVRQAESYALLKVGAGTVGSPVILRVSSVELAMQPDRAGHGGDVYVEHAVAPDKIEILFRAKWQDLVVPGPTIVPPPEGATGAYLPGKVAASLSRSELAA